MYSYQLTPNLQFPPILTNNFAIQGSMLYPLVSYPLAPIKLPFAVLDAIEMPMENTMYHLCARVANDNSIYIIKLTRESLIEHTSLFCCSPSLFVCTSNCLALSVSDILYSIPSIVIHSNIINNKLFPITSPAEMQQCLSSLEYGDWHVVSSKDGFIAINKYYKSYFILHCHNFVPHDIIFTSSTTGYACGCRQYLLHFDIETAEMHKVTIANTAIIKFYELNNGILVCLLSTYAILCYDINLHITKFIVNNSHSIPVAFQLYQSMPNKYVQQMKNAYIVMSSGQLHHAIRLGLNTNPITYSDVSPIYGEVLKALFTANGLTLYTSNAIVILRKNSTLDAIIENKTETYSNDSIATQKHHTKSELPYTEKRKVNQPKKFSIKLSKIRKGSTLEATNAGDYKISQNMSELVSDSNAIIDADKYNIDNYDYKIDEHKYDIEDTPEPEQKPTHRYCPCNRLMEKEHRHKKDKGNHSIDNDEYSGVQISPAQRKQIFKKYTDLHKNIKVLYRNKKAAPHKTADTFVSPPTSKKPTPMLPALNTKLLKLKKFSKIKSILDRLENRLSISIINEATADNATNGMPFYKYECQYNNKLLAKKEVSSSISSIMKEIKAIVVK